MVSDKKILKLRRPLARFCKTPTFLVIGAQKSGTTSIFRYLTQHPDIMRPVAKTEAHYFDKYYDRGPQWYRSNFSLPRRGKITGEKSPYYLYHPLAAQRCYAFNNGFRLIVLLRDPVKRAYSHFHHEFRKGRESRPFRRAVEEERDRVDSEHGRLARGEISYSFAHQHYSYLARGRYVEQLDLWMQFFPREQFYIETAERFSREPQVVCSEIFSFLELSPFIVSTAIRHHVHIYNPMLESDQIWLAGLFRESNSKLANSYGVNISDWI